MDAAAQGHGRKARSRYVMMARAFGQDISERKAQKIIDGDVPPNAPSGKAQEKKLQQLADKHDWDL